MRKVHAANRLFRHTKTMHAEPCLRLIFQGHIRQHSHLRHLTWQSSQIAFFAIVAPASKASGHFLQTVETRVSHTTHMYGLLGEGKGSIEIFSFGDSLLEAANLASYAEASGNLWLQDRNRCSWLSAPFLEDTVGSVLSKFFLGIRFASTALSYVDANTGKGHEKKHDERSMYPLIM